MEVIAAGTGRAITMSAGDQIDIINPAGTQVVDTWALCLPDTTEHLSMEHTRAALLRLVPRLGDQLVTNRRRPVLTLVDDTSPGVHDTLIPACDPARYRLLGAPEGHASCQQNFLGAVRDSGLGPTEVPSPLNLFMNIPWSAEGRLEFAPPLSRPGDLVRLRAELDLLLVLSACPQDLVPVNGVELRLTDIHYRMVT
ncbi:MAG: uncharacterized protein QOE76_1154 [Frankiales bacterium]|jgi:uncharacterized protein YcgI (DUF1989 family)|nr:uncharacterized protein [Frankiales bacterium]